MAADGIRVEGAAKLRRTMKQAQADIDELKQVHAAVAALVASKAASAAPSVSGRLRGSIRSSGTARASIVRAGRKSIPYAGVIHWGWPGHNIRPNPFISKAAQDSETQWYALFLDGIQDIIDKVEGA